MKGLSKTLSTTLALGATLNIMEITADADEGMWLFNAPPREILRRQYNFEATDEWLQHVQKSSVRFNSGGSGSFVSEDGLIISNHHVGADALQKLSDAEHNYLRDGFHARTRAEEKKALDLELNVLMSIEDVTDRVKAAVKPDMSSEQAFLARRAVMAEIEKESLDKTGMRSDVVTLFRGGQYHLYRFKRYTDVRLVFAPEQQIAFFGGDPDNFEYPRYDLDFCLFRAYENDQPVKPRHYLKWSPQGVADGDLVFVSGHPGRTDRSMTVAELKYTRDYAMPYRLQVLHRREVTLLAFSERSQENARRAKDNLFGVQNSRKARRGMLAGLLDPALMAKKAQAEEKLRQAVRSNPNLKGVENAWNEIVRAQEIIKENALFYRLLEVPDAFNSSLFHIARTLWRSAVERPKPNGERLREFTDSARESLELDLFSEQPIYEDLEQVLLADSLTWLAEQLGADHELVRKVLAGKSPQDRAAALVHGTKVKDVELRRSLYRQSSAELEKSEDPLILLARLVDEPARAVRKVIETQDEVLQQAHARITQAKLATSQEPIYPDATFTLRLAFGQVKGYADQGRSIPFQTTFEGLYDRSREHQNQPPFDLPPRWIEAKSKLDLKTPFNFVSTADIIGGNSGSPVINRQAEFVGIIFDGNIHSLVLDFLYTDKQARAVSVNSQAIIESLRKVYDAGHLADELLGTK